MPELSADRVIPVRLKIGDSTGLERKAFRVWRPDRSWRAVPAYILPLLQKTITSQNPRAH